MQDLFDFANHSQRAEIYRVIFNPLPPDGIYFIEQIYSNLVSINPLQKLEFIKGEKCLFIS